ncbi:MULTISPECIES: hypothetical protein [Streptomyces]|uniref:hypothetical protein n=1 Tax=Streptomyces TaxID=1883 RepID=UPI002FCA7385
MSSRTTLAEWLACSDPDPRQVWKDWMFHGVAVLPVGTLFGAVRIPEAIVHAALESTDREYIHPILADRLDGPVIHDGHGHNYYALIGPEAHLDWGTSAPGVKRLAPATQLGVPATNLHKYTARTPIYWAVSGAEPRHCAPGSVALLVRIGAARLEEAAA